MSERSRIDKLGQRLRDTQAVQDRQRLLERLCLHPSHGRPQHGAAKVPR